MTLLEAKYNYNLQTESDSMVESCWTITETGKKEGSGKSQVVFFFFQENVTFKSKDRKLLASIGNGTLSGMDMQEPKGIDFYCLLGW